MTAFSPVGRVPAKKHTGIAMIVSSRWRAVLAAVLLFGAWLLPAKEATAATIFSSYPVDGQPALGVNPSQYLAVEFFTGSSAYKATTLAAPFMLTSTSQPLSLTFELWDNHVVEIFPGETRDRPLSLLGSWTTETVDAFVSGSGPFEFDDISVDISPTLIVLQQDSAYWLKVLPSWSTASNPGATALWAGSASYSGFGYSPRMLQFSASDPDGVNVDPGNFLAFSVEGEPVSAVPVPAALPLMASALAFLGVLRARRLRAGRSGS